MIIFNIVQTNIFVSEIDNLKQIGAIISVFVIVSNFILEIQDACPKIVFRLHTFVSQSFYNRGTFLQYDYEGYSISSS